MDQENAEHSLSNLKLLSADDKGYTVELTVGDPIVGFKTEQKRIPPITVVSFTTRVNVDPQLERCALILSPDESEAQTERVRQWKNNSDREKQLVECGLIEEMSEQHSIRVLKAFLNMLEPVKVIPPFRNALTKLSFSGKSYCSH